MRIEPYITVNPKGKGKKKDEDEGAVEGVIYRVSNPRSKADQRSPLRRPSLRWMNLRRLIFLND